MVAGVSDDTVALETPAVDEYLRLRRDDGLSPRSEAAARAGLPQTIAGVEARRGGHAVGLAQWIRG